MSFSDCFIIAYPQVTDFTVTYTSPKQTLLEQVITALERTPRNSIFNAGVAEPGVGEFTTCLSSNHKKTAPRNSIFNAGVTEPGVGEFTTLLRENIRSIER